jgi:hypothetical protein
MAKMWADCLLELRVHWENKVPVPHLHTPSSRESTNLEWASEEEGMPAEERILWSDVLAQKAAEGVPFSIPDDSASILFNKLRMLQMCIVCVGEDACIKPPWVSNDSATADFNIPFLQRRLPCTRDHIEEMRCLSDSFALHSESLLDSASSQNMDDSHDTQEEVSGGNIPMVRVAQLSDSDGAHNVDSAAATASEAYETASEGSGQRDMTPLTSPLIAAFRLSNPVLLSDIRAFKAANEHMEEAECFQAFCSFYSATEIGQKNNNEETGDIARWTDVWSHSSCLHADDQKLLFDPVAEAEKALEYLEGTPASTLAQELLIAAMSTAHFVLHHDLLEWQHLPAVADSLSEFKQEIIDTIQLVRAEMNHPSDAISQDMLLAVDAVCMRTRQFELFKTKSETLKALLPRESESLAARLSFKSDEWVAAEAPGEVRALLELARASSMGHRCSWHSLNGRELGHPEKKKYHFSSWPSNPSRNPAEGKDHQVAQVGRSMTVLIDAEGDFRISLCEDDLDSGG